MFTVILTGADVVIVLAESVASAVRLCGPFTRAAVLNAAVQGDAVQTVPKFVPSTFNCTLAMVKPVAAEALAVTATLPLDTVVFGAGAVIVTLGGGEPAVFAAARSSRS